MKTTLINVFFLQIQEKMWSTCNVIAFCTTVLTVEATLAIPRKESIYGKDQIVFSSQYNITTILVPVDGKYAENNDMPTIFFAVSDSKFDSGTCIYVLEGFAAFEVLEGGRDSTADYGSDKNVYFGAKDGLYQYDKDSLSAKRIGVFRDDIIQLQKAKAADVFYILTNNLKMYRLENNATVKVKLNDVQCARQFVLDTNNNLYYDNCKDRNIHIIRSDGSILVASDLYDFNDLKLVRPPFVMEECIPVFGDGTLYVLCSNGSLIKKDFHLDERPSAISFDAALYIVVAVNGKIYEYSVMDLSFNSMLGFINEWTGDISTMIISMVDVKSDPNSNFYAF